ncbi:MAG: alpha/beta fold hydrolase [Gammaproteobacteria bacterium]|nr:alpha/beta fold hydrolase [Gammaproteobacteria bacterium]
MKRKLLVPALAAIGMVYAFPAALKFAFRPPQRPIPRTPKDLDLPEEEVWLDGPGGKRLHAWFIPTQGTAPAVVVLHGWGGNAGLMLPFAPPLHRAGFHTLFVDARNHGLSDHDDHSSMPRFAEDLDVAVDWLLARDDVTSVGIVGHSVGAGASILAASRRDDLGAVVSLSAFAHPGELMGASKPFDVLPRPLANLALHTTERIIGYDFDEIAPRNRISHVQAPLLLVHGDADQIVPVSNVYELAERMPTRRVLIIPGAGHSDLGSFESQIGEVIGFLSEHLH